MEFIGYVNDPVYGHIESFLEDDCDDQEIMAIPLIDMPMMTREQWDAVREDKDVTHSYYLGHMTDSEYGQLNAYADTRNFDNV